MEGSPPPKRFCSKADQASAENLEELGPVGCAQDPKKPSRPAKAVAYVRPTRCILPARANQVARRGWPRGRGRAQRRADRGSLDTGFQEAPRSSLRSDLQLNQEESGGLSVPENPQARPFPFTEPAGALGAGEEAPGSVWPPAQAAPAPSSNNNRQAIILPCIGFSPLEGTTLRFMRTSFGTHVFGVPVFFRYMSL